MDPKDRSVLFKTLELAEENNRLLRKINRRARNSGIMRMLYWLIILGISFGTYYYIQPYVDALRKTAGNLPDLNTITSLTSDLNSVAMLKNTLLKK